MSSLTAYGYSSYAQQQYAYQYELDQQRKVDKAERKLIDFLISMNGIDESHKQILCQRGLKDLLAWAGMSVAQNFLC